MNFSKSVLWAIIIVLAIGLVVVVLANNANLHDYAARYASNKSATVQPAMLYLDEKDFRRYLQHQFNVILKVDEQGQRTPYIAAGICQLASAEDIETIDELASEASLELMQTPWWETFSTMEGAAFDSLASDPEATEEDLREAFIADLLAAPGFTKKFRSLLTAAALDKKPPIPVHWMESGG